MRSVIFVRVVVALVLLAPVGGHARSCPEEAGEPRGTEVDKGSGQSERTGRNDQTNPDRSSSGSSDVDRGSATGGSSGSRGFEESGGGGGRSSDF